MSNWTETQENRKKAEKKDMIEEIEVFDIPTSDYTRSSVKYTITKFQLAK